jgi:hypothetical protein
MLRATVIVPEKTARVAIITSAAQQRVDRRLPARLRRQQIGGSYRRAVADKGEEALPLPLHRRRLDPIRRHSCRQARGKITLAKSLDGTQLKRSERAGAAIEPKVASNPGQSRIDCTRTLQHRRILPFCAAR